MNKILTHILSWLCLMGIVMTAHAQTDYSDMPGVKMFYPGASDNPMELKPTTKAYIYFNTGAQIVACRANIRQEGQVVGTLTYTPMSNLTTCVMDPNAAENSADALIQQGQFTLEFTYLTYMSGEVEKTYDDEANPYASVTYYRGGANGTIVSESGLDGRLILSYYPEGGDAGVKTFTFSKPITGDDLRCYLSYAGGDMPQMHRMPITMSDDGLTITIDLRGICNNVAHLAPGVTFVDDMGNPCDPPTSISFIVENLNCTDGTKITSLSTSLDGNSSTTLDGKIHQAYNYQDITLPTPTIQGVVFYDSAVPATTYADINANTDMFKILLSNEQSLTSADIRMAIGQTVVTIADGDYQKEAGAYISEIPAAIKQLGSDGMTVSLENVVYAVEDGAEHVIAPFDFESKTREVLSLADLKQVADGSAVVLNMVTGMKVTMSNDQGYTFAEDANDGIMILTEDYSRVLTQGTMLTGHIAGQYLGSSMFMIEPSQSDYTETEANVEFGAAIQNMGQLLGGEYDFRLVSIMLTADWTMEYDALNSIYTLKCAGNDAVLPVATDFIENFENPSDPIVTVTGIYFNDGHTQPALLLRSIADLGVDSTTGTSVNVVDGTSQTWYNLNGIRVVNTTHGGLYIGKNKKIYK